MVLGLSLYTYTTIHTVISLVALAAGIIVVLALLAARVPRLTTALFLFTAVATDVTGFGFPVQHFLPSHGVGILSLLLLVPAILALYTFHLVGAWRWIYAVGAVGATYFLVFVTIFQAFLKVPAIHALAPTLSETPFAASQIVAIVVFVMLLIAAALKFRPDPALMA